MPPATIAPTNQPCRPSPLRLEPRTAFGTVLEGPGSRSTTSTSIDEPFRSYGGRASGSADALLGFASVFGQLLGMTDDAFHVRVDHLFEY